MRPLHILTWNTHGSYLYYLSQVPHHFHVLVKPGSPPGYAGCQDDTPWGPNIHNLPASEARHGAFDCILFQDDPHFEKDQYELLTAAQRALPRIYIEHDPPREHPTDMPHPVDDPNVMLVHVSHFNQLMWMPGRSPQRVIEHGVMVPDGVAYEGSLARGLVVINHLSRRGRRLGGDLYRQAAAQVPLALVGMGAEELGGLGEIPHQRLPAFAARYRFLFNPIRYTSLGLAVIEAMMTGLPVVGLATTEMATVLRDGENGFASNSPEQLIERMALLLREPALAKALGARARRDARERFGIARFVADWERVLREVTGAAPGQPSRQWPLHPAP